MQNTTSNAKDAKFAKFCNIFQKTVDISFRYLYILIIQQYKRVGLFSSFSRLFFLSKSYFSKIAHPSILTMEREKKRQAPQRLPYIQQHQSYPKPNSSTVRHLTPRRISSPAKMPFPSTRTFEKVPS